MSADKSPNQSDAFPAMRAFIARSGSGFERHLWTKDVPVKTAVDVGVKKGMISSGHQGKKRWPFEDRAFTTMRGLRQRHHARAGYLRLARRKAARGSAPSENS